MNAAARQLRHAAALLVLAHCALVSAISSSPPLPPSPPPGTCLPNSNYTICFAAPSHGTGSPSPAGDCTLLDTAMVNSNVNWGNTQRFCGSSPPAGVPAVPSPGPSPAFYYCTSTTALTDYAMRTLTITFATSSTLFLNNFVSGYSSHSVNASALWLYFSCRTASPMPSGTSAASWGLPYAYTLPKLSPAPTALSFPSPHSSPPMPPPEPLPTGTLLFRIRNHDTLLCLAAPSTAAAGTAPTYQANCSSSDSYWLFNAQSNLVHQTSGLCLSRQGTIDQFSNAFLALSASCDTPLVPLAGSPSNRLGVVLQEQYLPKWCLHAYGGYAELGAPPVLYNDCVFESRIELDLVPVPPTPELAGVVFIAPLGCYKDTPSHLLSTVRLQHAPNMTPALCANLSLGQMYFGVQNGTDCYSGSFLTDAVSAGESAACNTPCSGDSNQTCGGPTSNSIYLRSPAAVPAFTLGCYLGLPKALLSTALLTKSAAMSVDLCSSLAALEGFAYFGVFNGTDCYGGDNLTLAVVGGLSSTCNVLCAGFAENCGGVDSTRIYKLLTVTPPQPPPSPPTPQPSPPSSPSPRPSPPLPPPPHSPPPAPPSPHSPPPAPPSPHSPPPSPSTPRPRSPPPPRKPSPPPRPHPPPPHPPPPSPMATLPCSVCTTYRLELDVNNPGPMWSGPVPPLPSNDTCSTLASYMTDITTGSVPLTFTCTAVTVEQFNHGQVKVCAPGSGADTAMAVAMFHAAGDGGFNLLVYQALTAIGYAGGEPYTFLVQNSCGAPADDFYSSIMT